MNFESDKKINLGDLSYPDFLGFFGVDNTPPGGMSTLENWIKNSGINDSSNILDLACSTGFSSRNIALKTGCRASGIDLSASSIKSANAIASKNNLSDRLNFDIGDAECINFPDNEFTHITAGCCFGFISNKKHALNECYRVLKKNGCLCISPFFYESKPDQELINLVEGFIGYKPDVNRDYDYWKNFFNEHFTMISEELYDLPCYDDDEIESITQQAICNKDEFLTLNREQQQIAFDRYFNTRIVLNEHAKYQSIALWVMRAK